MTATPPEWAEALLRLVLDRDHADSVSGDLLEEYRATIHPAGGQSRADRWYVMQTLGYVARSAGFWAAIFGGAFVARTSLDWLAPTDDFHVRSAVSTSIGVGTLMVAGLWAGWRSSDVCGRHGGGPRDRRLWRRRQHRRGSGSSRCRTRSRHSGCHSGQRWAGRSLYSAVHAPPARSDRRHRGRCRRCGCQTGSLSSFAIPHTITP